MSDLVPVAELERRMRPGAYSEFGFLGVDESLEEVLAADRRALADVGVTHDEVADALERVLQVARARREELAEWLERDGIGKHLSLQSIARFSQNTLPGVEVGYPVGAPWQVFLEQYRGMQNCPWGCPYDDWASFDFLILNRRSGEYVTGPGMIVHLLRAHRFFEGRESPYRVDPGKAIRVLNLHG